MSRGWRPHVPLNRALCAWSLPEDESVFALLRQALDFTDSESDVENETRWRGTKTLLQPALQRIAMNLWILRPMSSLGLGCLILGRAGITAQCVRIQRSLQRKAIGVLLADQALWSLIGISCGRLILGYINGFQPCGHWGCFPK